MKPERRRVRRWIAAAAVLLVGCGSTGTEPAASHEPFSCAFPYPPPPGYVEKDRLEVPAIGHIGVRQVLVGGDDRDVILTAGIAGEFGEGLPVVGEVPIASGGTASLIGERHTWMLIWSEGPPCATITLTGNGFTRRSFRELAIGMGLVAHGGD